MTVGFTGTRNGLTARQREALLGLLRELQPAEIHHGNCLGADEEFSLLCCSVDAQFRMPDEVSHPCSVPSLQSRKTMPDQKRVFLPPLDRNRNIVDACEMLIACPGGMAEEQRSGTWYTVRYARRCGRPITIVWPDGTLSKEG